MEPSGRLLDFRRAVRRELRNYSWVDGERGNVPGGGCRVRHTSAQLSPEASLSFACQARASELLMGPRKNTGNDSGFGSAPGDSEQCLPTLTPAVSAGGLSLIPRGARPESAPSGPEPV